MPLDQKIVYEGTTCALHSANKQAQGKRFNEVCIFKSESKLGDIAIITIEIARVNKEVAERLIHAKSATHIPKQLAALSAHE